MNNYAASPTVNTRQPSWQIQAQAELEIRRRNGNLLESKPLWQPNPDHPNGTPNTQRLVRDNQATILGISGTAGWGKTYTCLGLAATEHHRSVIFRRIFKNLRSAIEDSREIFNATALDPQRDSYNESLHRWKLPTLNRQLEFEACQYEHDKYNQRGRPRDLYVFDEAPEFSKSQIDFIIGWLRTTRPKQRCRVILAFNPPSTDAGTWINHFFLPWLAYLFPEKFQHNNPATPGELRWYTTLDNGEEIECANSEPFEHHGKILTPISRSFLFGTLDDNPVYKDSTYVAMLQSMPEPERSRLLYGSFAADAKTNPRQVIPTAWVKLAQQRWMEREKPDMPLSSVGVDIARGGVDKLTISKRYGTWFQETYKIPGVDVEDGPAAAGMIADAVETDIYIGLITIDIIGVGTSAYDTAKVMWPGKVYGLNVAEKSDYVAMSKTRPPAPLYRMRNKRAEIYWRMREALDPEYGDDLALPPGNEIVADLCAAEYDVQAGGVIQIESKDSVKKRLGRSPDEGEAVMMANMPKPQVFPTGIVAHGRAKGWQ